MPRASVWTVRFALSYLLFGFSLGAILLANKGVPFAPWAWKLLPGHIDILMFGFVIQLAMGIAYWILPRSRTGSRGRESIHWAAVGLLNLGIWTVALTGWLNLPILLLSVGRLFEGLAAAMFVAQAWWRIRPTSYYWPERQKEARGKPGGPPAE